MAALETKLVVGAALAEMGVEAAAAAWKRAPLNVAGAPERMAGERRRR